MHARRTTLIVLALVAPCCGGTGCSAIAAFHSTPAADGGGSDADGTAPTDADGAAPTDADGTTPTVHPSGFGGIAFAHLIDSTRRVRVYWHPATAPVTSYQVYDQASRTDVGKPIKLTTSASGDRGDLDKLDARLHYLRVVAMLADGTSVDFGPEQAFALDLRSNTVHTIAGIGRAHRAPPDSVGTLRTRAVAADRWDNLLLAPTPASIAVWCRDDRAPYCNGRAGLVQTISGRDGIGSLSVADSGSTVPADHAAHGEVSDIAVTRDGDIYFSDITERRIYAICYSAKGRCSGVPFGHLLALHTTGIEGRPLSLAIDAENNILYTTDQFTVRALCRNKKAPYCASASDPSTILAGVEGNDTDGGDVDPPTQTPIGHPSGVVTGAGFNVYFGDARFARLRALCNDNTVGLCRGKGTSGVQRITSTSVDGTPVSGIVDVDIDTDDNIVLAHRTELTVACSSNTRICADAQPFEHKRLASGSSMKDIRGVALDRRAGVFASHDDNVRVICNVASSIGCGSNATPHDLFSALGSGPLDVLGASVSVNGIASDSAGNVFFSDPYRRRVSALCLVDSGLCKGLALGLVHDIAGNGTLGGGGGTWSDSGVAPLTTPLWHASGDGVGDLAFDKNDQLYLAVGGLNVLATYCQSSSRPGCSIASGPNVLMAVAGDFNPGRPVTPNKRRTTTLVPLVVAVDAELNPMVGTAEHVVAVCLLSKKVCQNHIDEVLVLAGNGNSGDSDNKSLAINSPLSPVTALAIDGDNLLLGTRDAPRLQLLCNVATGRCSQSVAGYIYQLAGSGTANHVEGPLAQPLASASLGTIFGISPRAGDSNVLFSSSRRLRAYCETAAAPCKAPSTVQVIGGNTTVERAASGHTLAPTAALGDVTKVVQTNSGLLVAAGRDGLKLVLP